jgi:hypothetical protein
VQLGAALAQGQFRYAHDRPASHLHALAGEAQHELIAHRARHALLAVAFVARRVDLLGHDHFARHRGGVQAAAEAQHEQRSGVPAREVAGGLLGSPRPHPGTAHDPPARPARDDQRLQPQRRRQQELAHLAHRTTCAC